VEHPFYIRYSLNKPLCLELNLTFCFIFGVILQKPTVTTFSVTTETEAIYPLKLYIPRFSRLRHSPLGTFGIALKYVLSRTATVIDSDVCNLNISNLRWSDYNLFSSNGKWLLQRLQREVVSQLCAVKWSSYSNLSPTNPSSQVLLAKNNNPLTSIWAQWMPHDWLLTVPSYLKLAVYSNSVPKRLSHCQYNREWPKFGFSFGYRTKTGHS